MADRELANTNSFIKRNTVVLVILFIGTLSFLSDCKPGLDKTSSYLNHHNSVHYVGKEVCQGCHTSQYESFVQTGMGQSFKSASKALSAAKEVQQTPVFDRFNQLYYWPHWEGEELWIREFKLLGDDTSHSLDVKVDYIIGSGQHTNSHLIQVGEHLFQAPLTYYAQEKRWGLPPGFEAGHNSRFNRMIDVECMSCHNSMPTMREKSTTRFVKLGHGIDCERCHGPGSLHVEWRSTGVLDAGDTDLSIVNPSDLSLERQIDVCQRCHLQGLNLLKEGKGFADFRPGMKLSDYFEIYLPEYQGDQNEFDMANHAARFQMSKCFTSAETDFSCISCHNPHLSVLQTPTERFNASCLKCHESKQCGGIEGPQRDTANCVSCHMPKRATTDIQHVQVHDHYIRKPVEQEQIAEVKKLIGLYVVNTEQPDHFRLIEAYLLYWEKFDKNPFYLQKAKQLLEKKSQPALWLKYYFLKENYKTAWSLREKLDELTDWQAYMLGETALQLGHYQEGHSYLQMSYKLNNENPEVMLKLIKLKIRLNLLDEASAVCEASLKQFPNKGLLWNQWGAICMKVGNRALAKTALEEALRLEPLAVEVWEMHFNLDFMLHDVNGAQTWAKRILKTYPNHPDAGQLRQFLE